MLGKFRAAGAGLAIICLLFFSAGVVCAQSQPTRPTPSAPVQPEPLAVPTLWWQPIGTIVFRPKLGVGDIVIRPNTPPVKAIRLVARSDVRLDAVAVTYASGRVHIEERVIRLVATDRTKPIDPTDPTKSGERVGTIEVYGRLASGGDGFVLIDVEGLSELNPADLSRYYRSGYDLRDVVGPAVTKSGDPTQKPWEPKPIDGDAPPISIASTRGATTRPPIVFQPMGSINVQPPCIAAKDCALVPVFFGTNRDIAKSEKTSAISLGPDRLDELKLGRAFITVPRRGRTTGSVSLPGLFDLGGADPKRHFTMPVGAVKLFDGTEEFLTAARAEIAKTLRTVNGVEQRHAFVFVHGYRVSFENAAFRAAQIAYDLSSDNTPFATAFMYSWPSAGNAADYVYDLDSARLAAPHLAAFLELVIDKTDATHVHVIAHSMGNVTLIDALTRLKGKTKRARINQIILAAHDVDKIEFEKIVRAVTDMADGTTLYASASDRALLLSRLGRRNTPRAGDVKLPPGPALVQGMYTIDVSALSSGAFSLDWNHDTYADSRELINDIAQQFRNGPSKPTDRNINFRPEPPGNPLYWRWGDK